MQQVRLGILVASDKGFSGERKDLVIDTAKEYIGDQAQIVYEKVLPDERQVLAEAMKEVADNEVVDILITSGGTGLSPRDVTPEATMDVIERSAMGIAEGIRAYSSRFTNKAMLSRGVAGIRRRTLIINLPGSPKAVKESLECILPLFPHMAETLRGEAYECGRE